MNSGPTSQDGTLELRGGQYDGNYTWDDTTKLLDYPPCHFTLPIHAPAQMHLNVRYVVKGQSNFDFLARVDTDRATAGIVGGKVGDAKRQACVMIAVRDSRTAYSIPV